MGTGCVFNRTALYGYEPPLKPRHKKAGGFSSLCGGSRKKSSKSSKKGSDKKKSSKHVDPTVPIFSLEDIEEGVEGMVFISCSISKSIWSRQCICVSNTKWWLSYKNVPTFSLTQVKDPKKCVVRKLTYDRTLLICTNYTYFRVAYCLCFLNYLK